MSNKNNRGGGYKPTTSQTPPSAPEVNEMPSMPEADSFPPEMPEEVIGEVVKEAEEIEAVHDDLAEDSLKVENFSDESKDVKESDDSEDELHAAIKKTGFSQPNLLVNVGTQPTREQRFAVLSHIDKELAAGNDVFVEATVDNGDYPSRVRRSLGEKFRINSSNDFSFYWMKLVVKE